MGLAIPSSASKTAVIYNFLEPLMKSLSSKEGCSALAKTVLNFGPMEAIQKGIRNCLDLDTPFTSAKLTPFHLAAIMENEPAMQALAAAGANRNAKDHLDYTPLHHMAMKGNTQGVKQLIELGAKESARTSFGGTYMDFLRFNAPFRQPSDFPMNSTLFSAHRNDQNTFDPVCLGKNVRPVAEMVASPDSLVREWSTRKRNLPRNEVLPHIRNTLRSNLERYAEFKKNPPKLSVAPILKNDAGEPLRLGGQFCGLIALEPIKAGAIIAEYTGEIISPVKDIFRDTTYLELGDSPIDANFFRSPAAMSNDAFPNASTEVISFNKPFEIGLDGLSERNFLFALDDIAAGEQITQDYGPVHNIKLGNHAELRKEAVRRFLQQYSWADIVKGFKKGFISISDQSNTKPMDSETARLLYRFYYLLNTPSTFQWAAKEGLVTKSDLERIQQADKEQPFLQLFANANKSFQLARAEFGKKEEL